MRIRNRYLEGKPVDERTLVRMPVRSKKIEEIFMNVKRRAEE